MLRLAMADTPSGRVPIISTVNAAFTGTSAISGGCAGAGAVYQIGGAGITKTTPRSHRQPRRFQATMPIWHGQSRSMTLPTSSPGPKAKITLSIAAASSDAQSFKMNMPLLPPLMRLSPDAHIDERHERQGVSV
jgi:hypothetical protein